MTLRTLIIGLMAVVGAAPGSARPPAGLPHDFHVVYARMGVEGNVIQVRLRFFQDDLALALRASSGNPEVQLSADPVTDSLVTAYLGAKFQVRAGDGGEEAVASSEALDGAIIASGEELESSERIWWYVVQYVAQAAVERVHVDAAVLLELFDDQSNILRIQHFPSEQQRTYYLTRGSSEARFSL